MYRGMAAIIENNYDTGMNILITTGHGCQCYCLGDDAYDKRIPCN